MALPWAFLFLECRASDGLTFDLELLRQRGLSEELAAYFRDMPRFTPGNHIVSLTINGSRSGTVQARFLNDGSLCIDTGLLEAGGIRLPTAAASESQGSCIDLLSSYPQSQIQADPQSASVTMVVPAQALRPAAAGDDLSAYDSGGFAAMFNYDVSMLDTRFKDGSSRSWTALTEPGLNLGDWIVRSRQIASLGQQASRLNALEAYAQRTFADQATVLQVGQIQMGNPVLSGVSVDGFQLFSEQALGHLQQRRVVQGIAKSQARVEIYQRNRLVYATVVPPGPFSIDSPAPVDAFAELEMVIHEADGEERRLTLPASPMAAGLSGGYQFGIGQLRHSRAASPWVLSAGWSGSVLDGLEVGGGLIATDSYQATGFALGAQPWTQAQMQWSLGYSQPLHQERGMQSQMTLNQQFAGGWGAGLTYGLQSQSYQDLQQALEPSGRLEGLRDFFSVGLSWQGTGLGNFSVGGGQSRTRNGQTSSQANLRWGATLGQVSLNAGVEWSLRGADDRGRLLYMSASVPLGTNRRLGASTRASGDHYRSSFNLREQVSDTLGYRLSGSHDSHDPALLPSVGVSWLAPFSQVQLDYSKTGDSARTLAANLRGGALGHAQGITLAPYSIQDTFALIEVGDLHGVKVDTPSGPVWTDRQGRAIASRITPYADNRVQVQPRSLPRSVDLANSLGIVRAGRGAVSQLSFIVERTRRVLLQTLQGDGPPLADSSMVVDANGSFVTMVQAGGLIFLHDFQEEERYHVTSPDGSGCALEFTLSDSPDPEQYYETTTARCHAI
ncbi:TPA: fimbria/pilus outer membrane usher protein [Pseudomonas putida]|jgi:outer membrane usher protein FimD/PapC|uniref:Fimbrial biogenesis outer membrane usher protein n=2 Tax=Pseudomonas TaxID=286 RepID=B0KS86_PSEPG|nr:MULTISPECIES: fimbria/pilus outer membrane usher protein [Pseudomonas]ABY97041.1 fimbrial biogenesis outer membrane usher protein [Pseudomonas putida GB-1]MBP0706787.1 fimbria/pilus outer membrane usher protein [Pseudomonas sp. T34]MCE1000642.1 fimbria/pilus outer membrane usher protein [Pseudomonas sp. NMI1173_11]MCK2186224.1 fimbria/pilus outer membrane usher protein [Pseudomonas sp. MB04B]MDD2084598.1 fimbria/pilus outer membrane usher protein [Pseudomonas putida]